MSRNLNNLPGKVRVPLDQVRRPRMLQIHARIRIKKNAWKKEITSSTHLCIVPSISNCLQAPSREYHHLIPDKATGDVLQDHVRMWRLLLFFMRKKTQICKINVNLPVHCCIHLLYLLLSTGSIDDRNIV